jgi:hypothetical protein
MGNASNNTSTAINTPQINTGSKNKADKLLMSSSKGEAINQLNN